VCGRPESDEKESSSPLGIRLPLPRSKRVS